jgi:hypothetical protein
MQLSEFAVGKIFWCSGRQWRCTDIGTRTVIAIRIDRVEVGSPNPELRRTLNRAEAEAEGWFNGPPYASAETVFDEDFLPACSLVPDDDVTDAPDASETTRDDSDQGSDPLAVLREAGIAQAIAIREQARAGGLRFEAYLPPALADWLLDQIEGGMFVDPSEAVFAMLGEHQELEPHADLREEILRRSCQAAMDDPHPGIPHEEVMKRMREFMEAPRPQPAVWRSA